MTPFTRFSPAIIFLAGSALFSSCNNQSKDAQAAAPQFAGCRALVLKSDIAYNAWDSVMYGALSRKGMDVAWEEGAIVDNPTALAQYDLIAMNIRRSLTPTQIEGLKTFLASGGGIYVTTTPCWGGNELINRDFLKLCGADSYSFLKLRDLTLLNGPLTEGFGETKLLFPAWSGHVWNTEKEGVDLMSFVKSDGISVARSADEKCLGILKEHGPGRTALLSVGAENYKFCFPESQIPIADRMLENTLRWLMPRERKEHPWPNEIEVRLPRRAEVLSVSLNDKPLVDPKLRFVGSLRTISIPVASVKTGDTATVKITYKPLSKAQNIETWIHHPSGEFCNVFDTPSQAADFLATLHVSVVQPLLRAGGGGVNYRGIPGDPINANIKKYAGDYLAEYIEECHRRGIKVVGGFYQSANAVLEKYPEAAWIGKDGKPAKSPWVCLNSPKGQEHNLDAFRQLVENYQLDAIMLDDNYQLIDRPCYCDFCKSNFEIFCQRAGKVYKDPSTLTVGDADLAILWNQCMVSGTQAFCDKMRAICAKRGIPLGAWVNGAVSSSTHNAATFDFLGGMIYEVPAYASHGPLSILGEKKFINMLWAMNRAPGAMQAEVEEAIRSGDSAVGFWTQFLSRDKLKKENWGLYNPPGSKKWNNWFVEPGGLDAMARAFGRAEQTWLSYYKDNLLAGDARFALKSGALKPEELTLTIKNCGKRVPQRILGKVDLSFLQ